MDSDEIAQWRLRNQRLAGAPLATADEVVRWLGAVQSQEYAPAQWSLGQRAEGVDESGVERALAAGTILRTHVLRPTWHFVLATDIRWMIELTGPRVQAQNAYWYRKFGLDDELLARSNALLGQALADGTHLTRKEVAALLGRHGIAADGLRLGYLLMRAELDLVTCSGARKGRQHTYALLERRAPQAESLSRDEALATLTRRYFTSHGPATVKDYVWWSSLTVTDARRGLELLSAELEQLVVGDRTYWFAPSPPPAPVVAPTAHLLQGYDEYAIAYSESRDVLDVAGVAGKVGEGQAMFTHAIVLDGQVVGHWRRAQSTSALTIEVQLGLPLDAGQRAALDHAVDRYGRFVHLPATWTSGP